ncbi:MAG: serine--tRNA ligase [Deltaproteobacteria bacterium]|jgi:seryl-tRNA synthetase|nr:serine--tRNA ligase [Deltaproteobacteria bacterium]
MLDLKYVRDNLEAIGQMIANRQGDPATIGKFSELDQKRRALLRETEQYKSERNRASDKVAELKKAGQSADDLIEANRALGAKIKELEPILAEVEESQRELLANIPNIPHSSVIVGDESSNFEVRRIMEPKDFDFTPKNHWEIGESSGLLDFNRAVKISGSRFVALYGPLSKLNRALIDFMLDLHTKKHGYLEVWPPAMINSASMYGTGQLPKFAEDGFKIEGRDLWLAPTAEVPLTNLKRDEIIDDSELPISLTAYTPCFRAEAGAAGRDTRGMIRMHQFDKVELVKFTRPDDSFGALEELTSHAEEVLKLLKLPYRVMLLSTGDMGFASAKTYDLEVFLPGPGVYREISSCSCFTDFQARRANIRFRRTKGGRPEFVHTLNGSGLAVGRTLIAILENYQQADGSVVVPEVLRPYMGDITVIGPAKG